MSGGTPVDSQDAATPAVSPTVENPNRISTNSKPATQPEESLDEVFYPSEDPADNEENKQGEHKTCDEIRKKSGVLNIVQSFDGKLQDWNVAVTLTFWICLLDVLYM